MGWIQLKSLTDLPYSVPPGLNYCRFTKLRLDHMAVGYWDPLVPEVSTPPVVETTGAGGGVQSGPPRTSTPGNFLSFIL